jgi:hypothetical protein
MHVEFPLTGGSAFSILPKSCDHPIPTRESLSLPMT